MKCAYPNKDNALEGICGVAATWVVRLGAQGYPVNEPVIRLQQHYCGLHAVAMLTSAVAEPERHYASVQAIRIENAKDMLQRAGRQIEQ